MTNILIIGFNRPDCIQKLIKSLLIAKPDKLFVALDGPRLACNDDIIKCKAVNDLLMSANWECDVEYLRSNHNLGCSNNVETAVNWFFDSVEEGIILEDDCIPNPSFIRFAHELLCRYRNEERVFQISGMSFLPSIDNTSSYLFSKLVNIWGWATWKSAWSYFIENLSDWPEMKSRKILACYGTEEAQQEQLIQEYYDGKRQLTWGIKWRLTCLSNYAYSVVPTNNLVQNIGFNRNDSTSKKFYHPIMDIKASSVRFPLSHPKEVAADIKNDESGLKFYYQSAKN